MDAILETMALGMEKNKRLLMIENKKYKKYV